MKIYYNAYKKAVKEIEMDIYRRSLKGLSNIRNKLEIEAKKEYEIVKAEIDIYIRIRKPNFKKKEMEIIKDFLNNFS